MPTYFGTDGVRGAVGKFPITPEFILKLGWAVGQVMGRDNPGSAILIGKDTRISGYLLESALEAGLCASGTHIRLLGPMPTPAIAYLTRTLRAQAGIVISASHNSYQDNGIKIFSSEGLKLDKAAEQAVEAALKNPMTCAESLGKASRINDAAGRYIEFCKSTVPPQTSLAGMRVAIDCANGADYHIAPCVLHELGADVIPIHNHPDGKNINCRCGSTDPKDLQKQVLESRADLGIALDGDGDRVVLVDQKGRLLDGDDLIYIIANACFKRQCFEGGVVGTVMTNLALEYALKQQGIPFERVCVGDKYVLAALQKLQWNLGGEPSGHIILLDKNTSSDGLVAALQVLAIMYETGQPIDRLKAGFIKFPQYKTNIRIPDDSWHLTKDLHAVPSLSPVIRHIESKLGDHGRIIVRLSGTESLVRIMVEGEALESVKRDIQDLVETVNQAFGDGRVR